jgi:hypothetical protein
MLYLLPWNDIPEAHRWVDDEIEVLFLKQRQDGFVENWFLDGNFLRTALLYAQYKSQGIMPYPWSEDVRIGAAYDKTNDILYVHLSTENYWHGNLRFDQPRHTLFWNMPLEYPRVNAAPQWYVVKPDYTYTVTDLDNRVETVYMGHQLSQGLEVILRDLASLRLTIQENPKP